MGNSDKIASRGLVAQLVRAVALGDRSVFMWYVYVLRSIRNKRLYTGSTNNIERRINEHNMGHSKYTSNNGPYELVYKETYTSRLEARRREIFLKSGKGRELLKALIKDL